MSLIKSKSRKSSHQQLQMFQRKSLLDATHFYTLEKISTRESMRSRICKTLPHNSFKVLRMMLLKNNIRNYMPPHPRSIYSHIIWLLEESLNKTVKSQSMQLINHSKSMLTQSSHTPLKRNDSFYNSGTILSRTKCLTSISMEPSRRWIGHWSSLNQPGS